MRPIDADSLRKVIHCEYSDDLEILEKIDNAPTIKTFTLADIEEQYRKGLEKGLEEARPHGEWKHDQFGDFFKNVLCSNCGFRSAFEFPFCPSCGTPMTEEALKKYNGLKEGEAE